MLSCRASCETSKDDVGVHQVWLVPIRKSEFQLYTMADAEKPTIIDTEKKDLLPEADLTKYKVGQAII